MNKSRLSKLIGLVKRYECLYDVNHVDYKNTVKKKILWQKIAKILKVTTATVLSDWKYLKLGYMKHKRLTSSSETTKKHYNYNWFWARHLAFLESKLEEKPKNYPWELKLRQEQKKDSTDDDVEVIELNQNNRRSSRNTEDDDEHDTEEEMSADDSSSSVIEVEVTNRVDPLASPARARPSTIRYPVTDVARISPTTGLYIHKPRPTTIQYPAASSAKVFQETIQHPAAAAASARVPPATIQYPAATPARVPVATIQYPAATPASVPPATIQYPDAVPTRVPPATAADPVNVDISEAQPAPETGRTPTSTPLPEGKDWQNTHFKNILKYLKSKNTTDDPEDLLLASYATTMKTLDLKTQTIVKIELAKIFAAAELEDLNA